MPRSCSTLWIEDKGVQTQFEMLKKKRRFENLVYMEYNIKWTWRNTMGGCALYSGGWGRWKWQVIVSKVMNVLLPKIQDFYFLTQQIFASKNVLCLITQILAAVRPLTSLADTNLILGKSCTVLKYGSCVGGCNIKFTIFNVKGRLHTPYQEV